MKHNSNPSQNLYYFNFLISIIIIFLFTLGNCYVKIPFKYFPVKKHNITNPSTIFQDLTNIRLYVILKVGTPLRPVHISLDIDSSDFYLSDLGKYAYEKDPTLFSDFNFYDKESSKSFEVIDYDYSIGDNFEISEYTRDFFEIGGKIEKLEFYNAVTLSYPSPGGIGLQLNPYSSMNDATPNETRTFFRKLKDLKLANNYCWSIFYSNKNYIKGNEGFVLMGAYPDQVDGEIGYYPKNSFKKEEIKTINSEIKLNQVLNKFSFTNINILSPDNKIENITFSSKKAILDFNEGGIKVPFQLFIYFNETVFGDFIKNKECFQEKAWYNQEFFYCKKSVSAKLKKKFPTILMDNNEIISTFKITADDVFYEQESYIFCLLHFEPNESSLWILGIPFLKKYQFSYDPENKIIIYYQNIEKKSTNMILIYVIIGLVIIILITGGFVVKLLLQKFKRKKRANELTDNDFEYIQQEDNPKDNLGINNYYSDQQNN